MSKDKNPYTNDDDDTPKDGFVVECFEWARKKELERISKLPLEEQKKIREEEKAFAARMNS